MRTSSQPRHRQVLLVLCALGILAGCTTQTKRKLLTFFFDGVPAAGVKTNAPVTEYDEDGRPLAKIRAPVTDTKSAKAPPFTAHPPYEEKSCNECHQSKFSVKLKGTQKQVCFACHDDFLEKAASKHQPADNSECTACHAPHGSAAPKMVLRTGKALCGECHDDFLPKAKSQHVPVLSGECLSCHNPHASTNKFLVKLAGKALCFDCHDDFLAGAKVKHAPAESGECSACHNPHASTNKFLMKLAGKSMCFDCHDDFLEKAKFKHTAVDDCSACHNAHKSSETALLIKPRAQLCLECHEQKDLAAVKGHAQNGDKSCLQCHDPHAGQEKFLLKAGLQPTSPALRPVAK